MKLYCKYTNFSNKKIDVEMVEKNAFRKTQNAINKKKGKIEKYQVVKGLRGLSVKVSLMNSVPP